MQKFVTKLWVPIIILLILALLATLFLWPAIAQPLVWILIIGGTGMAIFFTVRRRIRDYRQGRIDRSRLIRITGLEILGILITIILAVLFAGRVGKYMGQAAGRTVEASWPGMGATAAILTGLATGMVVGLIVGIVVQRFFGFLIRWNANTSTVSSVVKND